VVPKDRPFCIDGVKSPAVIVIGEVVSLRNGSGKGAIEHFDLALGTASGQTK
jgi:hypothetical protein